MMTWGEIKIIALQKMFAKDEPIKVSDLSKLKDDDDCKWYLSAMPSVCNEALQRIKPYVQNMYVYNKDTKMYDKTTIDYITTETSDDYKFSIPDDACVLIPLYIASQLYKDDDISQATAYRNEFEIGLQELTYNIENQDMIVEVY